MIERFEMTNTILPEDPGAGLSDEQKTWLDTVINSALQRIVDTDPRHRQVHFALLVLTLERVEEDGTHVVTSDTVTSLKREHLHETLRDWLHKETQ
jgi:hypothetical protein